MPIQHDTLGRLDIVPGNGIALAQGMGASETTLERRANEDEGGEDEDEGE
jgi:hypothetical protein